MANVKTIIEILGYSSSNNLYYCKDSFDDKLAKNRFLRKVVSELAPTAYYCVHEKPFILFFDGKVSNDIKKKIWNAQIPLVIICLENRIEIFNGCSIDKEIELVLLETIRINSLNAEADFSFWNITNSAMWHKYSAKFNKPKLDAILLDNIEVATKQLKRMQCRPFATQLVLRMIFIRYLLDRGVDIGYEGLDGHIDLSKNNLLEIIKNKDKLYGLFTYLKKQFNGNLFEIYTDDTKKENELVDDAALGVLYDLMSGQVVLSSGQGSFFPLYDFNIIPVELISNIYERFLGEDSKKNDKAFYTPPNLADYILKHTIEQVVSVDETCTILDPACGSGIFLVGAARRLIENNISTLDDNKLVRIVTDNIWGIDKNQEAINVAVFSIYLTILDYKDPKTLKHFKLPLLKGRNFFVCDFFAKEVDELLAGKKIDFIIGNPPWGNVRGEHVHYCNTHRLPQQNNEICRSFVYRTRDFVHEHTICCLILTSKLFYNQECQAKKFREWLLTKAQVKKYVELAAVRELVFTEARGPAGIIIYKFNAQEKENRFNAMHHLTLKPNIFFKLHNIIVAEKNDYKNISQALLLEDDSVWKNIVFGYFHDHDTIKRLKKKYSSVEQIIEQYKLEHGVGITLSSGDKNDATHLKGRVLIDAKHAVHAFEVNEHLSEVFEKDTIHRAKFKRQYLFKSPFVLLKKGFDTQTYKLRAAYSEGDFIYTDAITGICGTIADKDVLLSLTGLFNSSLYAYFSLMLGSSTGIEREQAFYGQILHYPALVDTQIARLVERIQEAIKIERQNIITDENSSKELINQLDKMILDKFGLLNDEFIDYALNVQVPLIANKKLVWSDVSVAQLNDYARVFDEYFSKIFSQGEKYIAIKIYPRVSAHYSVVEFLFCDEKPLRKIVECDDNQETYLSFVSKLVHNKINESFYQIDDVISFSSNSFFILKTNENKNWHPAMAKLDLDDVLDAILDGNEVCF